MPAMPADSDSLKKASNQLVLLPSYTIAGCIWNKSLSFAQYLLLKTCLKAVKRKLTHQNKVQAHTASHFFSRKMQKYFLFIEVNFSINWGNNLHSFTSIPAEESNIDCKEPEKEADSQGCVNLRLSRITSVLTLQQKHTPTQRAG